MGRCWGPRRVENAGSYGARVVKHPSSKALCWNERLACHNHACAMPAPTHISPPPPCRVFSTQKGPAVVVSGTGSALALEGTLVTESRGPCVVAEDGGRLDASACRVSRSREGAVVVAGADTQAALVQCQVRKIVGWGCESCDWWDMRSERGWGCDGGVA